MRWECENAKPTLTYALYWTPMSDRELDDWITTYLEYTEKTESPESFHIWCGLTVIAGALQRRVYLPQGLERTIYPNIYVVLVSPSGRARKGVALGIAKDLLGTVSIVSIAPESTSGREAIILAMKRSEQTFSDPSDSGKVKSHCALSAFSEELSVFLGQGDVKLLANLTDWYDSKDDWAYETIGRGRDSIQGVCFNMVGGTAPDWLQSMLPHEAVGGGYTARVIFVVEEQKRYTVPYHVLTEREKDLYEKLERDINRIALMGGAFRMTNECKDAYVEWYINEDKMMQSGKYMPIDDNRFSSYCERRTTHLRKLMMLLSASRGDNMLLEKCDFDRGIDFLLRVEKKMHKTFGGLGQARYSDIQERVMDVIKSGPITTRSLLMRRFHRDLQPDALAQIELSMLQMGVIQIEFIPDTQDKVYRWIGPTTT